MSVAQRLKDEATHIASDYRRRVAELEKELAELEHQKLEKQALCDAARLAFERALKFQPALGSEHTCPRCWARGEVAIPLAPIPGTSREDFFRCGNCHFEIAIPV